MTDPPHPLHPHLPHSPFALFAFNLSSQGHTKALLGVVFSPCGKTMCTAGGDHTAKIWDRATGTCKKTLSVSNLLVLGGRKGLHQGAGSSGSVLQFVWLVRKGWGDGHLKGVIGGEHVAISEADRGFAESS